MKTFVLYFLCIVLACPLLAQKRESDASLRDTIAWMTNFTNAHGYLMENGKIVQSVRLTGVQECRVMVEHQYLQSNNAPDHIKKQSEYLELGDFDPDKVRMLVSHAENGESFEVDFERSDAADKIVADTEMGDGRKTKSYGSSEWIFMDSEVAAKRLATALTHAIRLCGGKPAPF